jgi:tetratricopeptide (TPR) repeat protein
MPAMFDNRVDWGRRLNRLRERAPVLAALVLGLLALSPSPVARFVATDMRRVRSAQMTGRPADVLDALAPILALEPQDPRLRLAAADAALQLGQPAVALEHLQTAGLTGDRWRPAGCLLVRAQAAQGDIGSVDDLLDRLIRYCPTNDPTWLSLVQRSLQDGDAQAASHAALRWTEAQPANPEAHINLGLSLALDDPERALSSLRTARALSPTPQPLASALAQAIEDALPSGGRAYELAQVGQALARLGRWDLAVMAFSKSVDLEPGYVEAQAYLGLALDRIGKDGETELTQASQAVPSASLPHVFLAQHWVLKGDPDRAADELTKARALEPDNPAIAAQLGAVYSALGDLQSALAAYQDAAQLAPDVAEFQSLLSAFSIDHEIDVAGIGLPSARRAALLDPGAASQIDHLGFAYYLIGNPEMAEHMLILALHDDPVDPAIYYHLGLARLAVQKSDLAELSLRQAAALDPGGVFDMLATRTLARLEP